MQKHHVLTLATVRRIDPVATESLNGPEPYCAACFYVFEPRGPDLVFLSDKSTRHGQELLENERVGAQVYLETTRVDEIQGVQITGRCRELERGGPEESRLRELYFQAFPRAREKAGGSTFWRLRPDYMKMTDNRIAFGHKIIWEGETK